MSAMVRYNDILLAGNLEIGEAKNFSDMGKSKAEGMLSEIWGATLLKGGTSPTCPYDNAFT